MKKQWIIGGVVLLVVILAAWFFWPKDQSSHARVIPADATALMAFDTEEFIKESDLTEEKLKKFFPGHEDLYQLGLDFEKNAYGFVGADGMNGFLFPVNDVELLKEYLNKNGESMGATPVEEQQGFFWSSLGGSFVIGFDDEVLLIMGPTIASAQAELRQQMIAYLKQDKKESVLEAPIYKKLQEQKGILKAVTSLEMFPEYYKMFENLGLPEHVDFSKMLMTVSMDSENGKILFRAGVIAEDKALAQKMKALDDLSRQIDGEFLSSVSPNTMVWMGANVKGEKLMKLMSEIPSLRLYLMAMNNVMDVEKMIQNIDGDIALSATMDKEPQIQMQAQMANLSFMDDVDYWISSARNSGGYLFEKVDEDLYRIGNVARSDIYLGLKDKNVLLTNSKGLMVDLQKGMKHDLLEPYKDDIKDSKFYVWTNMGAMNSLLGSMSGNNDDLAKVEASLGKIEAIALRSSNATSMELILYLKDKKSGLKQFFE